MSRSAKREAQKERTNSPRRNSTGSTKGSGHGTSPSGETDRPLCFVICAKTCDYWHQSECAYSSEKASATMEESTQKYLRRTRAKKSIRLNCEAADPSHQGGGEKGEEEAPFRPVQGTTLCSKRRQLSAIGSPRPMVGETFSSFSMLTSVPLFTACVLKKCALLALHNIAEEGRDADGFQVPGLGDEWKMAAQKVQSGRVKAKLGRRMKMRAPTPLVTAMCSMMRCTSSGCMGLVTRSLSLFLKDWELARVALSCHMALEVLEARKCMRPGCCCVAAR